MFSVAYFLKRKPGTSAEEFKEYCETRHAPLYRQSLARSAKQFSRKYLRPRRAGVDKNAVEPTDGKYDGVVELVFETRENWDTALHGLSADDINAIKTDEAKFTDRSSRLACVVGEHISPIGDVRRDHLLHWKTPTAAQEAERTASKGKGAVRGASFFKRKPGMSHEAFKDYYETRHVLIGYEYITYNAILYSRKFLRPLRGDPFAEQRSVQAVDTPYDVFMELSYEAVEDRQVAVSALTAADIETIAADEARFMDRSDRVAFVVDGPFEG